MKDQNKYFLLYLVLSLTLLLFFAADIFLGSVYISPWEVLSNLFTEKNAVYHHLITQFRLPKAITAVMAGMSLSVCGMLMQTLFKNPLAGPYVLGISSGSSLGVAVLLMGSGYAGITTGGIYGKLGISVAACIGGLFSTLSILFIAKKLRSNLSILLIGMMLGYVTGALQSVLEFTANPDSLKGFILWGLGSLSNPGKEELFIIVPATLICLFFTFTTSKSLNALLLGEHYAQSLGINSYRTKLVVIVLSALLTGITTAFCGPLAFIGLAIPHLSRILFKTTQHHVLIVANALLGACALLLCDIISQLPGTGYSIPINVITSLIGAPLIIVIIIRQKQLY